MKKIAAIVLSLMFVLSNIGVPLTTLASGTAVLSLVPISTSVKSGDSFTVGVSVNPGGASLDTVRVELSYDPAKLSASVFNVGTMFPNHSPSYSINNTSGLISFGMYKFGTPVTASGIVGTVTFKALAAGAPTISVLGTSKLIQDGTEMINTSALGSVSVSIDGVKNEVKKEDVPIVVKAPSAPSMVYDPAKYSELIEALSVSSKPDDFAKYRAFVKADALQFKIVLSNAQEIAIANFETYGISAETVKLGAGERRAVIRDYFETVGRSDVLWDDIQRMITGQKLVNRNLAKEQAQVNTVLANFKKMVGHTPNFKDAAEDIAWNTMMYRLRFPRDLVKEQAGIVKFRKILKHDPSSPLDWSMVRALGYAL